MAQFPGGGGGGGNWGGPGGGNRGSGENGRAKPATGSPNAEVNLDGNVPKGNSKVTGYIVNETLSKAVEYASVALYNQATKNRQTEQWLMKKVNFRCQKWLQANII